MKILNRYIIGITITSILTATLLVLGVDFIFALVRELKRTGVGDYTPVLAFQAVVLTLPHRLYDTFPMASLLGAILGLGTLAAQSELIVMRASGMSVKQIAFSVMTAAFALTIIVVAIGEWVVPAGEHLSSVIKVTAKSKGVASLSRRGTWIRDGQDFIYARVASKEGILMDVIRYRFNEDRQIELATHAQTAELKNHQWILKDVKQSHITTDRIIRENLPTLSWKSVINPDVIQSLVVNPDDFSISALIAYMKYLNANALDTKQYSLALWKKLLEPIAIMVMVFISVPFVFGPLRNATMGLRMLAGITVGFLFFMSNELFGPVTLVYNWPPILGALLPCVIFAILGGLLIRKVH